MNVAQSNLQPKGGTYGAGRSRRGGDEAAGLNRNGSLRSQGADHNPRPGKLRRHPELHGLPSKVYARLWLQKKRRENIRQGLTWDGQPRHRPIRFGLTALARNQRHAVTNHERLLRLGRAKWGTTLTETELASARKRIENIPIITNEVEIARLRVRLAKYERLGWLDESVTLLRFQCEAALQSLLERSAAI